MIPPALLPGLPPFGVGGYARDALEPYLRDFVALNAWRSDVRAQAEQAKARGLRVYLYGTPEHWRPDTWRASLGRIVAQCRELGCVGIIADAEGNWEGQSAQARALGAELAKASAVVNVGFTSYPMWAHVRTLAAQCKGKVWATPQLYGRTGNGDAVFQRWYAPWVAAFGMGRVVPSIAGWVSSDALATSEGYRAYLAAIPPACAVIAWDESGSAPRHILQALSTYKPGNRAAKTVEALFVQPLVVVTIAVALVAIASQTVKVA
jgi:hypothetical protein